MSFCKARRFFAPFRQSESHQTVRNNARGEAVQVRNKMIFRRRWGGITFLFGALGAALILFIAIPVLQLLAASPPSTLWQAWLEAEVHQAILLTLSASAMATALALLT